jgi:hypothetical protein
MHDMNRDGLMDILLVDTEGYLAFWERAERSGKRVLRPPRRVMIDEATGRPMEVSG